MNQQTLCRIGLTCGVMPGIACLRPNGTDKEELPVVSEEQGCFEHCFQFGHFLAFFSYDFGLGFPKPQGPRTLPNSPRVRASEAPSPSPQREKTSKKGAWQ